MSAATSRSVPGGSAPASVARPRRPRGRARSRGEVLHHPPVQLDRRGPRRPPPARPPVRFRARVDLEHRRPDGRLRGGQDRLEHVDQSTRKFWLKGVAAGGGRRRAACAGPLPVPAEPRSRHALGRGRTRPPPAPCARLPGPISYARAASPAGRPAVSGAPPGQTRATPARAEVVAGPLPATNRRHPAAPIIAPLSVRRPGRGGTAAGRAPLRRSRFAPDASSFAATPAAP